MAKTGTTRGAQRASRNPRQTPAVATGAAAFAAIAEGRFSLKPASTQGEIRGMPKGPVGTDVTNAEGRLSAAPD